MLTSLILAACVGQCPPGRVCPAPSMPTYQPAYAPAPVAAQPQWPSSREWLTAYPGNVPTQVWGWRDGENVRWYKHEQPAKQPTPAPEERQPTATVQAADDVELTPVSRVVGSQLPAFAISGVDRDKLAMTSGYQASHPEGQAFIQTIKDKSDNKSTGVPNDKDKPHLTIIGSPEDTAPIEAAIKGQGPLGKLAADVHFQSYTPDNPLVKDLGFLPGKPAVYVQNASGRVLHRQTDYAGGEAALVAAIEKSGALRKADPSYRPDRDPDHRNASTPDIGWTIVGVFALVVGFFVWQANKGQA